MFYCHAVIVDKKVGIAAATKRASKLLQKRPTRLGTMAENDDSFTFRNIPRKWFDPYSFKIEKLDDSTSLIVGRLKEESSNQE